MTLDPGQLKSALEGLQGWQVEDNALVRGIPATDDSRDGLVEAINNVASETSAQPEIHLQPDLVVLRVGDAAGRGVAPEDVELAARIDQVLAGTASDQGSTDIS